MAALWARTTNPRGAIGAGHTLADAAGARLADLEFMQFHPTALRREGPRDGFLITEAVRGEGARLLNPAGERFVDELAPRDQVALAIQAELDASGGRGGRTRYARTRPRPLPQHRCGARRGRHRPGPRARSRSRRPRTTRWAASRPTSTAGLRCPASTPSASAPAPGCTAPTGSPPTRSRSASCSAAAPGSPRTADPEPPARAGARRADRSAAPAEETRAALWSDAGLLRDPDRLRALLEDRYPLARLIAAVRLAREESRGAHQRIDHPERDPALDRMHTLVGAGARARLRAMGVTGDTPVHELFTESMTVLASGVAVITARRPDGAPCGIAATSLSSYSAHPPSLLVLGLARVALPRRSGDLRALRRASAEERRA